VLLSNCFGGFQSLVLPVMSVLRPMRQSTSSPESYSGVIEEKNQNEWILNVLIDHA